MSLYFILLLSTMWAAWTEANTDGSRAHHPPQRTHINYPHLLLSAQRTVTLSAPLCWNFGSCRARKYCKSANYNVISIDHGVGREGSATESKFRGVRASAPTEEPGTTQWLRDPRAGLRVVLTRATRNLVLGVTQYTL